MKSLWKQKTKIEFFHHKPNIIENFPIIEYKDLKLQWVKKAREDFQNRAKKGDNNIPGFTHLSRCPGIFELFKYGYVITLHEDIKIMPKKGEGFEWMSSSSFHSGPGPDNVIIEGQFDSIGQQQLNSFVHLIPRPPWTNDFIMKISTGWHVIAPKCLKFLVLPIAYPDTFDFTSTMGVLDPSMATQINFQMYWNATEPETIIRAGTPLGHLIPLSEKKYQMVQRIANQQDRDWVNKFNSARRSSFWPMKMHNKIIDMYNKHWHGYETK